MNLSSWEKTEACEDALAKKIRSEITWDDDKKVDIERLSRFLARELVFNLEASDLPKGKINGR